MMHLASSPHKNVGAFMCLLVLLDGLLISLAQDLAEHDVHVTAHQPLILAIELMLLMIQQG